MWIWYQERKRGEISILRMYGDSSVVKVPETLLGKTVTELEAYCFSEKQKYTGTEDFIKIAPVGSCKTEDVAAGEQMKKTDFHEKADTLKTAFFKEKENKKICALAGSMPTEIFLPDSLKKIGDFCFYQCRQLEQISFGQQEMEIGSDAFMNCNRLRTFWFRTGAENSTGLRKILLQRSSETDVFFENAAIHFPEFSQHYDLIGPAHIFELNIEGEGFRARQCFEKERFLFEKYDGIFRGACDTEPEKTLCKMAVFRLRYPFELKEDFREEYTFFLSEHVEIFCEELVRQKDLSLLEQFGNSGFFGEKQVETAIQVMMKHQWIQGIRTLLAWKKEWTGKKGESVYEFEDF